MYWVFYYKDSLQLPDLSASNAAQEKSHIFKCPHDPLIQPTVGCLLLHDLLSLWVVFLMRSILNHFQEEDQTKVEDLHINFSHGL